MFKWIFWLGLIGAGVFVGGQVIPVYYNNLKIKNVFEGVAQNLGNRSARDIDARIKELFKIQSIDEHLLPPEFYENLEIEKTDSGLLISSQYHVTLWLLDKPTSINPDEDFDNVDVKGMDKLRLKTRLDFDFSPSSE